MEEQKNLIWKDRKRVLGMPLTFTKYSLSEAVSYTHLTLPTNSRV